MSEQLIGPDDPFTGTWILDPGQSDYQFGAPPGQGSYRLEPQENGKYWKVAMEWVSAEGQSFQNSYISIPDGQDYPIENSPAFNAMSTTRVDQFTLDTAAKKDGVVLNHGRRSLSADGQTMTIVQSGTTPQGQPYRNLSVYRKQPSPA